MDSKRGVFHIKGILFICYALLIYYSLYNFSLKDYKVGLVCFIVSFVVLFDFQYTSKKDSVFNNLILTVFSFILLCGFLMFYRNDSTLVGRLWCILIPPMLFFTQSFKRTIIILSIIILLLIIKIFIHLQLGYFVFRLNIEQLVVFVLISAFTYVYAKAVNRNYNKCKYQIYYNSGVDLPNRVSLITDLKTINHYSISIINMDNFKHINNLYGYDFGDKIIFEISQRIKNYLHRKPGFKIYKLHSDEFCLVVDKEISSKELENIFYNLLSKLKFKISIDSVDIYPVYTIGSSYGLQSRLEQADMALKRAKELKQDLFIYNKEFPLVDFYKKNQDIALILKRSVTNRLVEPYFQPIVSLVTGEIVKYESLVRLVYKGDVISPVEFLQISKQIKLYNEITKIMVDKTFNYFNGKNIHFTINIDNDDLLNSETMTYILSKLEEFNIGPYVTFEILETSEIINTKDILYFIDRVKEYGCKIAIDDFGSGYSNFSYLLDFKVDYIKIDSSLIKNINSDNKSRIITRSIVSIARDMGIKTVAEYIENSDTESVVKELGVNFGQGVLYGAPEAKIII